MNDNQLIQGDALTELSKLQAESVDCCITSPPYWALRDYKTDGQLGLEPTIHEYINKLVAIFDQVKRVLKKTGSCWVVIGDTYNTRTITNGDKPKWGELQRANKDTSTYFHKQSLKTMQHKSLCMIPERFAISMIDHGWILRNKIIWYKPNCMPSSAKDRFTIDWEYVYFFTKSQKYYFETQYEPIQEATADRNRYSRERWPTSGDEYTSHKSFTNGLGRIKRCVWKISTKPFKDAHFAVFPPQLIEPMIKAGCPEYICKGCGHMRKLEYESDGTMITHHRFNIGDKLLLETKNNKLADDKRLSQTSVMRTGLTKNMRKGGFTDCGCNDGWSSGTVLDPFMGAGTTGMVALQNARDFIGIELNPEYVAMATKRLEPWLKQERLITV